MMKDRLFRHTEWPAYCLYVLVAFVVLMPLLRPGFILTLDMVFTPHLPMPDVTSSSYAFHALLHFLNLLIPADIIEKCLLFAILLLSGIGMHRLIRLLVAKGRPGEWGIYTASLFCMLNPFTYSR